MKITIEPLAENGDEEIIIRTNSLDSQLMELIYTVKASRSMLMASDNGEMVRLNASLVFYFESVDDRVCACCEKNVYEVKQKLYELEEIFAHTDLLRISKSMIVNISKISKILPSLNGRLCAVLTNGEKVVISRQYVPDLKKKLGM